MWLLNLDKKVKLSLKKENYIPGEIVKWTVSFEFWLEAQKIDKIFVNFRKKIISETKTYSNWSYSYSDRTEYTTILNKVLKWKWEYRNEFLDFEFRIPNNIIPKVSQFDKKLEEILNKLKIKWIFRNIVELMFSFLLVSWKQSIPTFEIEARLDIPWGKDVKTVKQIDIYESKESLNNEKELLTQISKEEWIYSQKNKSKIKRM